MAVKVLNAPAAEVMEDFQRECAILERLRHPNIIKYFGMASNTDGDVSAPAIACHTPSDLHRPWNISHVGM